ncbi:MAG TPA: hypothetical protein PLQ61_06785 [Bacteroidales bacterium]|nr:hypothetical protein [Petrotogaceae bacterium]HQJ20882.1 hypothetical protein [Bacteroidales bacterium]
MLNRVKDVFDLQLFAETQEGSAEGLESGGETEQQQSKTYDEAYVKKLRTESANYRTKYKELEASMNQKINDVHLNLFKALGLEPDPNKQYEKQIQEERQKREEAETRITARLIKAKTETICNQLGIIDPDLAYLAMDKSGIKVKDDDSVDGVKEALEALLKSKPHLKGSVKKPIGVPSNPGTQPVKESNSQTMNTLIRKMAGRIV